MGQIVGREPRGLGSAAGSRAQRSARPARAALALGTPFALALTLGASCAGDGPDASARAGFPRAADRCVFKRSITSWRPLDSRRFKLFADREYIVELMMRCGSLPMTESLEFVTRDEQVCDYRSDRIQTDDEVCTIASIRTIEEVEAASRPATESEPPAPGEPEPAR